jgi:hypothetical protein
VDQSTNAKETTTASAANQQNNDFDAKTGKDTPSGGDGATDEYTTVERMIQRDANVGSNPPTFFASYFPTIPLPKPEKTETRTILTWMMIPQPSKTLVPKASYFPTAAPV